MLLWFLCPQEFIASDPWNYSRSAFDITQNGFFGSGNVFDQRLAVTLPTAFLYNILGINIYTTNLVSLFSALLIVLTVWLALPDRKSKILGLAICLTNVPLFKSSVSLYPDLICSAFMALSFHLLLSRKKVIQGSLFLQWIPLAAVGFLFVAFLAKLSAYWVLPLWIWAFVVDLKDSGRKVLFKRFYIPVVIAGLCLSVGYLSFCDLAWGDLLARFKAIQAMTGKHLWAWDNVSIQEFVKRMTISPVRLFVGQYGALIILAFLGVVISPCPIKPWCYYLAFCIFFFWFGTTSFTSYEVMPLVGRMTLPMLPAFLILATFALSRLSIIPDQAGWVNSFVPFLIVVGLFGLPFAKYVGTWRSNKLPEAKAMSIVEEEVSNHLQRKYLLVCSDARSPESLAFYFSYHYPKNLRVVFVEKLTTELVRSKEIFLFLDRQRSNMLKSLYGIRNHDDEIDSLALSSVYESGDIALLKSEQRDQLKNLLLSNNRMEND